ncbi:MAG: Fur family transcriptional regulator [Candidatus Aminicenantales bacterium]
MRHGLRKFHVYLRNHGLKQTKTRELVFREVFSLPSVHPNAYEIQQRLLKKGRRVSLATIYRTLNLLVRSGFVSSIDLGEDHSHFEPERPRTAHGHLICLSCGRVREFSHSQIRKAIEKVGQAKGYRLDKFSLQVFGFCEKCRKG